MVYLFLCFVVGVPIFTQNLDSDFATHETILYFGSISDNGLWFHFHLTSQIENILTKKHIQIFNIINISVHIGRDGTLSPVFRRIIVLYDLANPTTYFLYLITHFIIL